ncbi:hypothetical protein [Hymenobacter sp. IS2118]|uniref:hypothetical protein n=1 Tax=Hymenobacter sp. IS2118 TaxID=1505605 RepID=UPI00054DFFCF|nr:hypothetical protein [Hymenobacter sp. IS2118]
MKQVVFPTKKAILIPDKLKLFVSCATTGFAAVTLGMLLPATADDLGAALLAALCQPSGCMVFGVRFWRNAPSHGISTSEKFRRQMHLRANPVTNSPV